MSEKKACWGPNLSMDEIRTWREGPDSIMLRHLSCRQGGWLVLDEFSPIGYVLDPKRVEALVRSHRIRCAHCFRFAGRQVRRYLLQAVRERKVKLLISGANPRSLDLDHPLLAIHYRHGEDCEPVDSPPEFGRSTIPFKPLQVKTGASMSPRLVQEIQAQARRIQAELKVRDYESEDIEEMDFSHLAPKERGEPIDELFEDEARRRREEANWIVSTIYGPNSFHKTFTPVENSKHHEPAPTEDRKKKSRWKINHLATKALRQWKNRPSGEE